MITTQCIWKALPSPAPDPAWSSLNAARLVNEILRAKDARGSGATGLERFTPFEGETVGICVMLYGLVMCMGEIDSSAFRTGVSVLRRAGALAGDAGVGCGLGSSGPMMLERRWKVVFFFVALFSTFSSFLGGT